MNIQGKKWQLTINNPLDKGFSHEVIKDALNNMKSISYFCLADECGEQGTFHTHVFLYSSSALRFSTIKKHFPEAHIEIARGTCEENKDYVAKLGKWENDEKHGTSISGSFEEWGELPEEKGQGNRTDLTLLYQLIKDGFSNYEIIEAQPDFMLRINDIERVRQTIRAEEYKKTFRQMTVTYIHGTTGSGKTRSVMEDKGFENVFRITDYKHPFDMYAGQGIIILDEYREQLSVDFILNLLDGYPLELPCRYSNKVACFTEVYIISNLKLEEQYYSIQSQQPETWAAILRRINWVITFLPNGTSQKHSMEDYQIQNGFVEISDYDLPFTTGDEKEASQIIPDTGTQLRLEEEINEDSKKHEGTAETDDM